MLVKNTFLCCRNVQNKHNSRTGRIKAKNFIEYALHLLNHFTTDTIFCSSCFNIDKKKKPTADSSYRK